MSEDALSVTSRDIKHETAPHRLAGGFLTTATASDAVSQGMNLLSAPWDRMKVVEDGMLGKPMQTQASSLKTARLANSSTVSLQRMGRSDTNVDYPAARSLERTWGPQRELACWRRLMGVPSAPIGQGRTEGSSAWRRPIGGPDLDPALCKSEEIGVESDTTVFSMVIAASLQTLWL